MRLTATAALNQLGSFANHLTSVQTVILYHIIAEHYAEHRLVVINRTYHADHVLWQCLANLEYQILGSCWLHWQYGCNNLHTIDFFCILYKLILGTLYSLSLELLNILLQGIVLVDVLSDDTFEILGVVEQALQRYDGILQTVDSLLASLASQSLDTADAGCYAALRDNLEETNLTGALGVNTTTELGRWTEANHTNLVAILLAEEGDSAKFLSLLDRSIAVLIQWIVGTDHLVYHVLYLAELLISYLLEVREVETQCILIYIRTLLLYVVAQNLLQAVVEQVGSCMVGCTSLAVLDIYASHEISVYILWQLLYDVDALVVLALGVDNLDGLVLANEYTLVANLSTHLTIEWSVVEYQLIERVLLLSHLAVAQDVALIFCIVVTHEVLVAFFQNFPVAVLYSSSIAGTLFLLLHLLVEACSIYGVTILTADKLCQVERETVCIEEAECAYAIKLSLAMSLELVHIAIEEVDTLLQGAEE